MKYKIVSGLLIVLAICSCNQQKSKGNIKPENIAIHQNDSDALLIKNGQFRGVTYTDSLLSNHNLRYMPVTIANDSTITMHLQINFANEYDFPVSNSNEKFNVIPMPNEWAIDGGEVTERMLDELPKYITKPYLNKTLEPGEEILLAIGTLFRQGKTSGIVPNSLFQYRDGTILSECDWLIEQESSPNSQVTLGLELSSSGRCIRIQCGHISYHKK